MSELFFDPDLLERWGGLVGLGYTEPDSDPVDPELVDRLRDAIDALPAEEREAVNGVFYEGVHKTEVARRLGVSRYHVDRYLEKALRRLSDAV